MGYYEDEMEARRVIGGLAVGIAAGVASGDFLNSAGVGIVVGVVVFGITMANGCLGILVAMAIVGALLGLDSRFHFHHKPGAEGMSISRHSGGEMMGSIYSIIGNPGTGKAVVAHQLAGAPGGPYQD